MEMGHTYEGEIDFMHLEFSSEDLRRLFEDAEFNGAYSPEIVTDFRKKVGITLQAVDERDFY